MTQDKIASALSAAQTSLNSINASYWKTTDEKLHQSLIDLALYTNDLITGLSQQDLSSNTAEFTSASALVTKNILPKIKSIQNQVNTIVAVDNDLKQAASDMMKLASSLSFLQVDL